MYNIFMSFLLHKTCLLSIQILSNTPSCGTVAIYVGFFFGDHRSTEFRLQLRCGLSDTRTCITVVLSLNLHFCRVFFFKLELGARVAQ